MPTATIEISSAVQARETGQLRRQSTSPFQNKYLMPLEIAVLATSIVTSFLMPLVKQGAEKISEAVSSKFSAAAGEHVSKVAKNIREKVKDAFSSDTEKATLTQFEKYPEESKPLVEKMLEEKMKADPKLATELDKLANSPSPGGGGTAVSIAGSTVGNVGTVNAPYATISGGIVAGVVSGTPPPSTPPPISPPNK